MNMAKASQADIEVVADFFQALEAAVEDGNYNFDDEAQEYTETDTSDERLAAFIHAFWPRIRGSWGRVVYGMEILVRECCDPASDILDWKPEIKTAMEKHSVKT